MRYWTLLNIFSRQHFFSSVYMKQENILTTVILLYGTTNEIPGYHYWLCACIYQDKSLWTRGMYAVDRLWTGSAGKRIQRCTSDPDLVQYSCRTMYTPGRITRMYTHSTECSSQPTTLAQHWMSTGPAYCACWDRVPCDSLIPANIESSA